MEGYDNSSRFEAGELRKVSEAFMAAFTAKCKEVFGTDMGISYRLSGQPPRALIRKEEPTGGIASPATWEVVKKIATEIASEYDLEADDIELIFDIDSYDGPTIIMQYREA